MGEAPVLTIDGVEVEGAAALNLLDKTDRELLQFRYLYWRSKKSVECILGACILVRQYFM